MNVGFAFRFQKAAPTGEYVRGWASVASVGGAEVADHEGDVISIDEIRDAAHRFITEVRVAKALHRGEPVGDVVESVIVDDDFAAAMGLQTDVRGWWIGMRIHDEAIRKRIRSGELKAFSIGGRGIRKKVAA